MRFVIRASSATIGTDRQQSTVIGSDRNSKSLSTQIVNLVSEKSHIQSKGLRLSNNFLNSEYFVKQGIMGNSFYDHPFASSSLFLLFTKLRAATVTWPTNWKPTIRACAYVLSWACAKDRCPAARNSRRNSRLVVPQPSTLSDRIRSRRRPA